METVVLHAVSDCVGDNTVIKGPEDPAATAAAAGSQEKCGLTSQVQLSLTSKLWEENEEGSSFATTKTTVNDDSSSPSQAVQQQQQQQQQSPLKPASTTMTKTVAQILRSRILEQANLEALKDQVNQLQAQINTLLLQQEEKQQQQASKEVESQKEETQEINELLKDKIQVLGHQMKSLQADVAQLTTLVRHVLHEISVIQHKNGDIVTNGGLQLQPQVAGFVTPLLNKTKQNITPPNHSLFSNNPDGLTVTMTTPETIALSPASCSSNSSVASTDSTTRTRDGDHTPFIKGARTTPVVTTTNMEGNKQSPLINENGGTQKNKGSVHDKLNHMVDDNNHPIHPCSPRILVRNLTPLRQQDELLPQSPIATTSDFSTAAKSATTAGEEKKEESSSSISSVAELTLEDTNTAPSVAVSKSIVSRNNCSVAGEDECLTRNVGATMEQKTTTNFIDDRGACRSLVADTSTEEIHTTALQRGNMSNHSMTILTGTALTSVAPPLASAGAITTVKEAGGNNVDDEGDNPARPSLRSSSGNNKEIAAVGGEQKKSAIAAREVGKNCTLTDGKPLLGFTPGKASIDGSSVHSAPAGMNLHETRHNHPQNSNQPSTTNQGQRQESESEIAHPREGSNSALIADSSNHQNTITRHIVTSTSPNLPIRRPKKKQAASFYWWFQPRKNNCVLY